VPRARDLALVDPRTADTTPLPVGGSAGTPAGVAWSPSTRQLAVSVQSRQAGERFGGADVLILDAAGAPISSVDRDQPDVALEAPAWLPDGEVVYERRPIGGADTDSRIEASLPDGSARRTLSVSGRLPGVSADGSHLAFVQPGGASGDQIVSLDLSSGEPIVLVDASVNGFAIFGQPRFSPDGQWVAFGASGGPGPVAFALFRPGLWAASLSASLHGPTWDVWLVRPDGSGLRQATAIPEGDDLNAAWSPDGSWLAAFGPPGLYIVPAFVAGPTTPISAGGSGQPEWVPSLVGTDH
jgi:Tol biopolymer transport system component